MHLNDSNGLASMTSGMSAPSHHHMESHFDNVLNLNMNTSADYHYGTVEYWNTSSYKNGSTPMKEMEGECESHDL